MMEHFAIDALSEHQTEEIPATNRPVVNPAWRALDRQSRSLSWEAYPEDAKFERLAPSRKRLTDTAKLIAYRSETAMSGLLRESLGREDDSRSLLRDLFRSDADVIPDSASQQLNVRIHTLAHPRSNRAIQHLLEHLNDADCTYPGTTFWIRYTLANAQDGVT